MDSNNTNVSSSGIGIGGLLFVIFLILKLTEKCAFWGDTFPRFLKSTSAWWDGWFMVFLPLWLPIVLVISILLIVLIVLKVISSLKK